jgi:hypothetical protein
MYAIENMTTTHEWTDNGSITHYHFTFGFTTKEGYLEQTEGWKADYKELSKRIRKYKAYRKPRNRPEGMEGWKVYSTLGTMQEQARIMGAMRVQAKVEAGRRMVQQQKAA